MVDEDDEQDKDEEEDKNKDDGKKPRTIRQGEMVNTLANTVDTMVDEQPIVIPEQGQEMCNHTLWIPPPAHTPPPDTAEPCP